MCTVYFVLAIVLANSYTVYCLLFLKTVNSTKITVKKKTVLPVSPEYYHNLFHGQSGAQTPQSVFDADFEILELNTSIQMTHDTHKYSINVEPILQCKNIVHFE